jgi:AraC-like DNA-binding protein
METSGSTFKHSFKTRQRNASLSVQSTGIQRCEPGFGWGPGIRDHYLVHGIVAGCGTFESNGKTYQVHAGQVFLIHPDTTVTYRAGEHDPWEYIWVGFDGQDALFLLSEAGFTLERPLLDFPDIDVLGNKMMAIYESRGSRIFETTRMTGRLYEFLSLLIEQSGMEGHLPDAPSLACVRNAAEYIAGNYGQRITVDDVASYAGTSRSGLYRGFRYHLGVSPMKYINQCRIDRACVLLQNTGSSIAEISRSVGFDDPLYFSRAFKKTHGCSPLQYRVKNR